jgi:hypothetical protein
MATAHEGPLDRFDRLERANSSARGARLPNGPEWAGSGREDVIYIARKASPEGRRSPAAGEASRRRAPAGA